MSSRDLEMGAPKRVLLEGEVLVGSEVLLV